MCKRTKYLVVAIAVFASIALAGPSRAALIEVTPAEKDSLSAEAAQKAGSVKNVTRIERYLLIKTQPHDVIGIEAGAPLRILSSDGKVVEGKLESGKIFRETDTGKNVAIIGKVYAEDYGYQGGMGAMAAMKHYLQIGQTFKLTEESSRIRVLGTLSVEPESEAAKVFLPLETAQKIFKRSGQLSHLFVTAKGDADSLAREIQAALGAGVKVRILSR